MNPEDYFGDNAEVVSVLKKSREQSVVVHQDGKTRSLAEEIQRAINDCHHLPRDKARDIENLMIYRNCDTVLSFVEFAIKESPCNRNLYAGIENAVEEFNDIRDMRHFRYFLPDETDFVLAYMDVSDLSEDVKGILGIPDQAEKGHGDESKVVIMPDGSQTVLVGIKSNRTEYNNMQEYLRDLKNEDAIVLPRGYFIRTPIQMLMTLMQFVCDNQIIIRRCPQCGKLFETPRASKKYCSKECALMAKKEQSKKSAEKEDVQAVYNFRQAVKKRFRRYCQGKTHTFTVDTLRIPASMTAQSAVIEKAVQNRNIPAFDNALEDLIEAQKRTLPQEEYIEWLETAGRKRGKHVSNRISEK
jgi:hypothetical protein